MVTNVPMMVLLHASKLWVRYILDGAFLKEFLCNPPVNNVIKMLMTLFR